MINYFKAIIAEHPYISTAIGVLVGILGREIGKDLYNLIKSLLYHIWLALLSICRVISREKQTIIDERMNSKKEWRGKTDE